MKTTFLFASVCALCLGAAHTASAQTTNSDEGRDEADKTINSANDAVKESSTGSTAYKIVNFFSGGTKEVKSTTDETSRDLDSRRNNSTSTPSNTSSNDPE